MRARRSPRVFSPAAGLITGLAVGLTASCVSNEDGEAPTAALPAVDGRIVERDGALPDCGSPIECGDDNPCTEDQCVDGRCAHVPFEAGAPCRDNDLCNGEEACDGAGACGPGEPVACELGGICVASACDPQTGACVDSVVEGCCRVDDDCAGPGASPCRPARCNVETGICAVFEREACCEADADCPAAGPCEQTRCDLERHVCERGPLPGCCTADAECPGEICAPGRCDLAANACATEPLEDCCLHDGDCPAPAPCERNTCSTETHTCAAARIPGCCTADAECGADETCDPAAGACRLQPPGCCEADSDCGAAAGCFVPVCGGEVLCCVLEHIPDCCAGDLDCPAGLRCDVERAHCEPVPVEFAAVQFPVETLTLCEGALTPLLFGRVYVAGRTPGAGQGEGLDAEVGLGPAGESPDAASWTFSRGDYNGDLVNGFGDLNDDEYRAELTVPAAGEYEIAWRFRVNDGVWVYGDLVPGGSADGYTTATALHLRSEVCE